MSIKVSRNDVYREFDVVKQVRAGQLQNLLAFHEPCSYNSGKIGWNFDVFDVYGIAICAGYRNMPGESAKYVKEYESKAKAIMDNYNETEKREKIELLLKEFCERNKAI